MKPEGQPAPEPTEADPDGVGETSSNAEANEMSENKEADGSYGKSADGFHGKSLQEKNVEDKNDKEDGTDGIVVNEDGGTFLTAVNEDFGQKKMLSKEDKELGIYEDTDVNEDDLSDTEQELERLRAEKKKRELEEKDRFIAEQKLKQQNEKLLQEKESKEKQGLIGSNVRSLTESAINLMEKQIITPRTDISTDSRMSSKSWSDPRFLQGISIKDLYWRSVTEEEIPITTSMQAEILQSRYYTFSHIRSLD